MKVALLYDGNVGGHIREFLLKDAEIELAARTPGDWRDNYDSLFTKQPPEWLVSLNPDWLVLAWWPKIINQSVINCAKHTVNIHNSFLPWCRGKHPNFWAIMGEHPYGVTLHEVTTDVDAGAIYAQEMIPIAWEDTGESLHLKSLVLAVDLFKRTWPRMKAGLNPVPWSPHSDAHHADEIEEASHLRLNDVASVRSVLNTIRARQCYGHAAWFENGGRCYTVTIDIKPTT